MLNINSKGTLYSYKVEEIFYEYAEGERQKKSKP